MRVLRICLVLVVAAALVVAFMEASRRATLRLLPPQGVSDLASFRRVVDPKAEFSYTQFRIGGRSFTEASKQAPSWTLRSGPTCSMFDEHGVLVDKTWDAGDDREWQVKWGTPIRDPF